MEKTVNIALQVLPTSSTTHPYSIVDKAIEIIHASGITYKVTPFETVMEGDYDQIMAIVKKAQEACYEAGAESMMTYIKIQSSLQDVCIDDKMGKYEIKKHE
jgi:uncharacterized protein YqgV (UPF0045/DUF77 family)